MGTSVGSTGARLWTPHHRCARLSGYVAAGGGECGHGGSGLRRGRGVWSGAGASPRGLGCGRRRTETRRRVRGQRGLMGAAAMGAASAGGLTRRDRRAVVAATTCGSVGTVAATRRSGRRRLGAAGVVSALAESTGLAAAAFGAARRVARGRAGRVRPPPGLPALLGPACSSSPWQARSRRVEAEAAVTETACGTVATWLRATVS